MTQNVLETSLKTCHWGYFDATLPPAMTISSGDEVVINTVSGGPKTYRVLDSMCHKNCLNSTPPGCLQCQGIS